LRAEAEHRFGHQFDIRNFHDMLIGNGSLPIALLEEIVNEWMPDNE
jgi:uncharacterized protein (DUF885 family)